MMTTVADRARPLVLFVFLTWALGCARESPHQALPTGGSPRQLTDWSGAENSPRVSPDGATLAFDARRGAVDQIFLMDLATSSVEMLSTGPGGARRPAWSPDGEQIAFISDRDGSTSIRIVPVDGGEPRHLLDAIGSGLSELDWSPDGTRIAVARRDPAGEGNVSYGRATVLVIDAVDGDVTELTTNGDEWSPKWSGDGQWLYYYVGLHDDLEAVHVETREVRRVGVPGFIGWRHAVSPDGSLLAFASDLHGLGLWVGSLREPTEPPFMLLNGGPDSPSFFPDGRGLVFTRDTTSSHVVSVTVAGLTRDTLARGINPTPFSDGGMAYLPDGPRGNVIVTVRDGHTDTLMLPIRPMVDYAYAPDGEHLVVTAPGLMDAQYDAHLYTRHGTAVRQLTRTGDVYRTTWCDDNQTVVFTSRSGKRNNQFRVIWSVDAATAEASPITRDPTWNQEPTHCDRDARRITFEHRVNATGQFVLTRGAGDHTIQNIGDGSQGRWSPDGTRLAYVGRRDGRVDIFIREPNGQELQVTNDPAVESRPRWSTDGSRLLFSVRSPNRNIWMIPLVVGDRDRP